MPSRGEALRRKVWFPQPGQHLGLRLLFEVSHKLTGRRAIGQVWVSVRQSPLLRPAGVIPSYAGTQQPSGGDRSCRRRWARSYAVGERQVSSPRNPGADRSRDQEDGELDRRLRALSTGPGHRGLQARVGERPRRPRHPPAADTPLSRASPRAATASTARGCGGERGKAGESRGGPRGPQASPRKTGNSVNRGRHRRAAAPA
ncbi:uncharacterized protein LOC134360671 [Cynocephalus volans]|uniref:uncharacterized protein LOC134360671 n=1 Tax=Cynocephalus volans TaxID=110931 RepID=UPI002FCA876F